MLDDRQDLRRLAAIAEDVQAHGPGPPHDRRFVGIQRAGLQEHVVGHADHAHVVQSAAISICCRACRSQASLAVQAEQHSATRSECAAVGACLQRNAANRLSAIPNRRRAHCSSAASADATPSRDVSAAGVSNSPSRLPNSAIHCSGVADSGPSTSVGPTGRGSTGPVDIGKILRHSGLQVRVAADRRGRAPRLHQPTWRRLRRAATFLLTNLGHNGTCVKKRLADGSRGQSDHFRCSGAEANPGRKSAIIGTKGAANALRRALAWFDPLCAAEGAILVVRRCQARVETTKQKGVGDEDAQCPAGVRSRWRLPWGRTRVCIPAQAKEPTYHGRTLAEWGAVAKEKDSRKRIEAASILKVIGPEAVPALAGLLKDKEASVRAAAALGLRLMGTEAEAAIPALTGSLRDKDEEVRSTAASALAIIGPTGIRVLAKSLDDKGREVWRAAAVALGRIGPAAKTAVPALTKLLQDEDELSHTDAAWALAQIGPEARAAVPALTELFRDREGDVCCAAAGPWER